ncbi:hypothetical protein NQ315_008880 [Exocentrus adspersus]|uniref:LAGLIDADG homing endonuclease n=1 Tax=Exocentrus adspersus TaxID=1586481 RepID=A0AAV8V4J2_9CUCU|nr:hypothetical protein NQ315_008880 [Exocentrus adspersus]
MIAEMLVIVLKYKFKGYVTTTRERQSNVKFMKVQFDDYGRQSANGKLNGERKSQRQVYKLTLKRVERNTISHSQNEPPEVVVEATLKYIGNMK